MKDGRRRVLRLLYLLGLVRVRLGAIIQDCTADMDYGRVVTRWHQLFGRCDPVYIRVVAETSELEAGSMQAAVHLMDQLEAARNPYRSRWWRRLLPNFGMMVILVNSATRGEKAVPRDNGSPFCYWWMPRRGWRERRTLIVSTLDGPVLPIANYYGIIPAGVVHEMDIPMVMKLLVAQRRMSQLDADLIINSQFRSNVFQVLVAWLLARGLHVPSTPTTIGLPDIQELGRVGVIDDFGQIKLLAKPNDFGYRPGLKVKLVDGTVAECIPRLADVRAADGIALTLGSNGWRNPVTGELIQLIEAAMQRQPTADVLGLRPGDLVVNWQDWPVNALVREPVGEPATAARV